MSINGGPVSEAEGFRLPVGVQQIGVSCKLESGISANFSFEVDLMPAHSYCFFSGGGPSSCKILYAEIDWNSGVRATCK